MYVYIYINVNVYVYILVGGFTPSEKYYLVSWDYYSQYMEKNVPNHQPVDPQSTLQLLLKRLWIRNLHPWIYGYRRPAPAISWRPNKSNSEGYFTILNIDKHI